MYIDVLDEKNNQLMSNVLREKYNSKTVKHQINLIKFEILCDNSPSVTKNTNCSQDNFHNVRYNYNFLQEDEIR